jgi:Protein of unknown function (DUF1566)
MQKPFSTSVSTSVLCLLAVLFVLPGPEARAQCSAKNGDVNADGAVDLSDAVVILGNLFLGSPTSLPPLCAPPVGTAALPATGQTSCSKFDFGSWVDVPCTEAMCPGQDAMYAMGCPVEGRFVDNGDGTVTDKCTGLMWQKDTADTSELFQDSLEWCDAIDFCEQLSFAGHDDWRLPNVRELQSIVDYGRREQAINPAFTALSEYYWSSTSYADAADDAWGVGFNVGYVGIRPKSGDPEFARNFVRAVRNAP